LDIFPATKLLEKPISEIEALCKISVIPRFFNDGIPEVQIGSLIRGFFAYFSVDYNTSTMVCRVSRKEISTREFVRSMGMFMQVKDPVTGWNVARLRVRLLYAHSLLLYSL